MVLVGLTSVFDHRPKNRKSNAAEPGSRNLCGFFDQLFRRADRAPVAGTNAFEVV